MLPMPARASIVLIATCAAIVMAAPVDDDAPAGPGFPSVPIFNGENLDGWELLDGDINDWSVVDGVLTGTGQRHGWIGTKKTYDNFRLYLEFRVPEGGNSGVFLRAPDEGNPAFAGLEVQVLDDRAKQFANLPSHSWCGGIFDIVGPKQRATKKPGAWQSMTILCSFSRVTVSLNGKVIVEADLNDHKDRARQHPGILREKGRIGLQSWGTKIEYRNIRIQHFGRVAAK